VLWEARGRFDYDETHPDDYLASNIPLLLFSGPTAVATVRLDLLDDATTAAFRRLAVVPERERQGYGRTLMEKAEAMAMERGRRFFTATVAKSAVPFWEKIGYGPANAAAAGENENPVMVKRG
jgi:GNAT superfamily N-acetyltransferase